MKQLYLLAISIILFSGVAKAQTIPNGDFETWNSSSYMDIDSPWISTNASNLITHGQATITQVPGVTGHAPHLQTYLVGKDTVISTMILEMPYSQNPTGISGYFRCNMVGHDTSWVLVEFLQNGNLIGIEEQPFVGTVNTFTQFNLPFTVALTPDSVVVGITSSNLLNNVVIMPGSWLEIDQLAFTGAGITQQIPDGGFEAWVTKSVDIPQGWQISAVNVFDASGGVSKSMDHITGNYALKMEAPQFSSGAQVTNGTFDPFGNAIKGQPFQKKMDTLTGYYKYTPSGSDSGGILIHLQNKGNTLLDTGVQLGLAPSWKFFHIPFQVPSTPDTMRIDLFSSTNFTGVGGSVLLIDDLQLKSQPIITGICYQAKPNFSITAFPDPAQNQVFFSFGNIPATDYHLKIYNAEGQVLFEKNNNTHSNAGISIESFEPGLYFYEVLMNGNVVRSKFVKERQ